MCEASQSKGGRGGIRVCSPLCLLSYFCPLVRPAALQGNPSLGGHMCPTQQQPRISCRAAVPRVPAPDASPICLTGLPLAPLACSAAADSNISEAGGPAAHGGHHAGDLQRITGAVGCRDAALTLHCASGWRSCQASYWAILA